MDYEFHAQAELRVEMSLTKQIHSIQEKCQTANQCYCIKNTHMFPPYR